LRLDTSGVYFRRATPNGMLLGIGILAISPTHSGALSTATDKQERNDRIAAAALLFAVKVAAFLSSGL
jgi:hypothetical protein